MKPDQYRQFFAFAATSPLLLPAWLAGLFLWMSCLYASAQFIPPMLTNGEPQAFVQFTQPKVTNGLALIEIPGGEYEEQMSLGKRGVLPAAGATTQSLGFQFAADEITQASGEFFVAVIYLDRGQGAIELDYVRSINQNTTVQTDSFFLGNSGRWLRHIFNIRDAEFAQGLSGGADFRINAAGVPIHRVGVSLVSPGDVGGPTSLDYQQRRYSLPPDITAALVGRQGISAAQWEDEALWRSKAQLYGSWGVEHYIETVFAGRASDDGITFDSTEYADHASQVNNAGLTWSPRIKVGHIGHLSLEMSQSLQAAMNEDGSRNGPMLSLWDAEMPRLYERFLADLGRRVASQTPFVVLSFAGDWGPLFLSSESLNAQGSPGHWAGDPLARASFREFLRQRYGNLDALNRVWGTRTGSWNEIDTNLSGEVPPGKTLEFFDWYEASMTELIERLVTAARRSFPRARMVIEVSDETRFSACDPLAIADIAQEHSAAIVMISREAMPIENPQWNRLGFAAATRGVPVGLRRDPTARNRNMNSLLFSLASQQGNVLLLQERDLSSGNAWDEYEAFWNQWRRPVPQTRVAVVYPRTHLNYESLLDYEGQLRTWRDRFAFDVVDEREINALSASQYPVLLIPVGHIWPEHVLESMLRYANQGGMIVAWTEEPWQSLSGDLEINERLFAVRLRNEGADWVLEPRRELDERFTNTVSQNPERTIVNVGSHGDSSFLYGRWGGAMSRDAAQSLGLPFSSFRWLGERGRVTMPSIPRRNYTLHVEGYLPTGYPLRVFVDKKLIGMIEGGGVFSYNVNLNNQWRPEGTNVEIQFRGNTWMTGEKLGMEQNYPVSVGISRVALTPMGELLDSNGFEANEVHAGFSIDRDALRSLSIRETGRGVTVLATSEQMNPFTFQNVVMAILNAPEAIDPGVSFSLPYDEPDNNVFVTPMRSGTLMINTSASTVRLSSGARTRTVTIPARSIQMMRN